MPRFLLLGAGFSRNWNGWLANELMGKLLGRLSEDAELHKLLSASQSFEDAISKVQHDFRHSPTPANKASLERMQAAVMATFRAMNESFARRPGMEFSNDRRFFIRDFLSRFDAIFTLNQDLLLELHYSAELTSPPRWNGHYFPGMSAPAGWHSSSGALLADRLDMIWRPTQDFRLEKNLQPIYKLHGSVNWKAGDNEMLVLGGNKAGTIAETALLKRYADEFRRHLELPNSRLMVIGYGFRDDHIDSLLYQSWQKSKFRMFIVDPRGRGVLDKNAPDQLIRTRNPLQDVPVIGESIRPLRTTFGGDDDLEHGDLLRFVEAA